LVNSHLFRYFDLNGKQKNLSDVQKQGMRCPVPLSKTKSHPHRARCLERSIVMIKLYKSSCHPRHWIAYAPGSGWLIFPSQTNGWEQRQPTRGLDPMHLREVPASLGVAAGFPVPAAPPQRRAA
jgi:hypothetical protein